MNNFLVLVLIFISCAIGALGALELKRASKKIKLKIKLSNFLELLKNKNLILGVLLYAVAALITIFLLRDNNLSLIYPLTSLTYVFAVILSATVLKEKITKNKILAVILIIIGNVLITLK